MSLPLVDYNDTSGSDDEDQIKVSRPNRSKKLEKTTRNTSRCSNNVKISIPALDEFATDDESEIINPPKQQFQSTGLLSVLPSPKRVPLSSTSFIPKVINRKSYMQVRKKAKTWNSAASNSECNSDGDDVEIPGTYDDGMWQQIFGKKRRIEQTTLNYNPSKVIELAPDVHKPSVGLTNKEFQEMVGNRGKLANVELADVHEEQIHADKEQWLKSLTDPKYTFKEPIENPVNNTRRIKNHITSLAQKALANDQELQMRWSENKYNRRLTQAKYGF